MPANYVVRADVVDIGVDRPQPVDAFLVDTNVWLWMAYTRASLGPNPPLAGRLKPYQDYFKRILAVRSTLYRSGLILAELTHQIERNEREIFQMTSKAPAPIPPKEFRHNHPGERSNVVTEVQSSWSVVKAMTVPLDTTIDDPTTDAALLRYVAQPLDGYDLFLLEAMTQAGVVQMLTDDGDYCTVPGIQVFTANQNVISAATLQGKLVTR